MWQELFRIPGLDIPIYGYGLMLVIGFFTATHVARVLARRCGMDGEAFVNAALLALVSGVVGARLSHILENFGEFTSPARSIGQNLLAMINIRNGGLTFYGGFLLAFPILVLYARWKKVPVRRGMDIIAISLMIGLGFGRIGCFLNGCCYGAECDLPWAVSFPYGSPPYQDQVSDGKILPDTHLIRDGGLLSKEEAKADPALVAAAAREHTRPMHPAQLYSALTAFLIAAIAFAFLTLPHAAGRGFALMLMLEGPARFLLEMLRTEPAKVGSWSLSMLIGAGLAALGVVLWFAFGRLDRRAVAVAPAPRSAGPAAVNR